MSLDLKTEVESIKIDEAREHVLTKIVRTKKGVVKVESDHRRAGCLLHLEYRAHSGAGAEAGLG